MLLHRHGLGHYRGKLVELVSTLSRVYTKDKDDRKWVSNFFQYRELTVYINSLIELEGHLRNILEHLEKEDNLFAKIVDAAKQTRGEGDTAVRTLNITVERTIKNFRNMPELIGNVKNQLLAAHGWQNAAEFFLDGNFNPNRHFKELIIQIEKIINELEDLERNCKIIGGIVSNYKQGFQEKLEFLRKEEEMIDSFQKNIRSWL